MPSVDVFGYVAGILGIIGLICTLVGSQRPTRKMKELLSLIVETQGIYRGACEDGLLPDPVFVGIVEDGFRRLYHKSRHLHRRAAYIEADGIVRELREMASGLSRMISKLKRDVAELRANILTTSEAEREKLLEPGGFPNRPWRRTQYSKRVHSTDECTLVNFPLAHSTPLPGLTTPTLLLSQPPPRQMLSEQLSSQARRLPGLKRSLSCPSVNAVDGVTLSLAVLENQNRESCLY